MIASAAGLSILAIIATILANLGGVETREGIWLTITVLPFIGLTFAFLLIIAFAVALDALTSPRFGRVRRRGYGSGRTGNHTDGDAWAIVAPGASTHRDPGRPARRPPPRSRTLR